MIESFAYGANLSATLSTFFDLHQYLLIYIGTVLFGEFVILSSFIVAGHSELNFTFVFLLSVMGTLTADLFWYAIGTLASHFGKRLTPPSFLQQSLAFLDRLTIKYLLLVLAGSKFLIGGRLITILYVASRRVGTSAFFIADVMGVIIFVSVLALLGFVSGKSAEIFLPQVHVVQVVVGGVVLIGLVLFLIHRGIERAFRHRPLD